MSRGTVGKTKDGIYYYSLRYIDAFGKEKRKFCQNAQWKTKKEALEALDQFRIQKTGIKTDITVNELFALYIDEKKHTLKQKSIYTFSSAYHLHIEPFFGKKIVHDISRRNILEWQKLLLTHDYKNRYILKIQEQFKTLILFGMKNDYISDNPFKVDYIKNVNERHQEMMFWTDEEFRRFISFEEDPMYSAIFKVLYFCGLREGEMAALTVADVNFRTSQLRINKTFDFVHNEVTTPKTKNSNRYVVMPAQVRDDLKAIVERHKASAGYSDDCLLFGFNKNIEPTTLKRHQVKACKKAEVKIIRIHDFRHSHVSMLIHLGINPFEIAKRLGHSVDMVNNVYGHLFPETDKEIVRKMEEYIERSSSKNSMNLN